MVENGYNTQDRVRSNVQDHQTESKRGHKEIQPRDHTRNDHGFKEPEESPQNAEATPRYTDHTPRWEIHDQDEIIERIEEFYSVEERYDVDKPQEGKYENLKNYKPIYLLSNIYKVLMKMLKKTLD